MEVRPLTAAELVSSSLRGIAEWFVLRALQIRCCHEGAGRPTWPVHEQLFLVYFPSVLVVVPSHGEAAGGTTLSFMSHSEFAGVARCKTLL